MKFKRIYQIPKNHLNDVKNILDYSFDEFLQDIEAGAVQLYEIDNNTIFAIMPRKFCLEIVLIHGENLKGIAENVLRFAKEKNIKTINAQTTRKGMKKIFESYGAILKNVIYEYELGI